LNNLEEKQASLILYTKARQILVSPCFLRRNGAGQVDLLFLSKNLLSLVEVKKSGKISLRQKIRLLRSGQLIGNILDKDCRVELFNFKRQSLREL